MKTCTKCHIEKEESEFYKRGNGLRADCKGCCDKRVKSWVSSNLKKRRAIVQKWDATNRKAKNVYRNSWRKKNPLKTRAESLNRGKRNRAALSDRYIRDIFRKTYGERLTNKDLIETKRVIIISKRKLKEHDKEKKTNKQPIRS